MSYIREVTHQFEKALEKKEVGGKDKKQNSCYLAHSFRVKFPQRELKEYFCCEKTIAENC